MTDTVVSGPTPQARLVGAIDGRQMVRGGQQVGDPIGSAIVSSYSNLVYSPAIVCLYFITLASACASIFSIDGPLEFAFLETKKTATTTTSPLVRSVTTAIYKLLGYLVVNKDMVVSLALVWLPYSKKPSTKNFSFSVIITLFFFMFSSTGLLELLMLSQCWFLFTELRNPRHKAFIGGFVGLIFLFNYIALPANGDSSLNLHYNWEQSSPKYFYNESKPGLSLRYENTSTRSFHYTTTVPTNRYVYTTTKKTASDFEFHLIQNGTTDLRLGNLSVKIPPAPVHLPTLPTVPLMGHKELQPTPSTDPTPQSGHKNKTSNMRKRSVIIP